MFPIEYTIKEAQFSSYFGQNNILSTTMGIALFISTVDCVMIDTVNNKQT